MKMSLPTLLILNLSLFIASPSWSEDNRSNGTVLIEHNSCKQANPTTVSQIEAMLPEFFAITNQAMQLSHVPGVAIAIVHRNKVIAVQGLGSKNIQHPDDLVDGNTLFQIASLSKPFTSSIIASLIDKHPLTWESKISTLDPYFKLSDSEKTALLTVGDLLSHQSGLPEHAGDLLEDLGFDQQTILKRLRHIQKSGQFRQDYAYTNFGYSEAAWAVAKFLHTNWQALALQFTQQLDMPSTSYQYINYQLASNKAMLHRIKNNRAILNHAGRNPDAQAPAGGLNTTANDFAHWLVMLTNKGCYQGHQIITSEVLAQTQSNQQYKKNSATSYGYGWNVKYNQSGTIEQISHSGAFSMGIRSFVQVSPQKDIGIAIFSNASWSGLPEFSGHLFFHMLENKNTDNWSQDLAKINSTFKKNFDIYHKIPSNRNINIFFNSHDYTGRFTNPYFGTVQINNSHACSKNHKSSCLKLIIRTSNNTHSFRLIGRDKDLFYLKTIGENQTGYTRVIFKRSDHGQVISLTIKAFDEFGNGTFMRK